MKSLTARELAEKLQGRLVGDGGIELRGPATLEEAQADAVAFYANPNYATAYAATKAGVVLVGRDVMRDNGACIQCENPYASFVTAIEFFRTRPVHTAGIHPQAVIAPDAVVDATACIGPFCVIESNARVGRNTALHANVFIGAGSTVGDNCVLYPGVVLREDTQVGHRVIIHSNAVIGADGFGFAAQDGQYKKIPQVGIVIIEDDVEIGANTTIDRATLGQTRIGAGTKIDNLVQVGHNVTIGKHCVIVAQTGIAGSTSIGDECRIGGQVGIVGHLKIGNRAAFGAQSGVAADVAEGEIQSGSPARPHSVWKRVEVALPRLPGLLRRVRAIEEKLGINKVNGK